MKRAGMTLFLLAILILGRYYYSASEKENSIYTVQERIQQDEMLAETSQALPEYVIENKEDPKHLQAQLESEKKTESAPQNQENQESQENQEVKEAQILQKYREQFLALQSEYMGKINGLIGEAENEYKAIPEATRSETSLSLGLKYLKKGSALESECDARFYTILAQMQSELEADQMAITGVQTAKQEYESQKNSRRAMLLGKATN